MQLFNIGAEGQLYLGAVGASWIALRLGDRDVTSTPLYVVAMCAAAAVLGALWALIPGVLRAFARTNEIITSLMLNYVAGLLLTYLIFDSASYWRDTSTLQARAFPQGKPMPVDSDWSTFGSSVVVPLGFLVGIAVAVVGLGPLLADAVRVRGRRHRRLAARRALRRNAHAPEDPLRDGAVRARSRASAARARSATSRTRSTAARPGCRRPRSATRASSSPRSPATTRSRSASSRCSSAGSRTPASSLQGADFPSGLVGVMQGIILFCALGGELLLRYRVRITRPPSAEGRSRRARRERQRQPARDRARAGGPLRDAAPVRGSRRAPRRALGRPEPRRRGDDAARRCDRVLDDAAGRRLRPDRALPRRVVAFRPGRRGRWRRSMRSS